MKKESLRMVYSVILLLACIGFVKAENAKYTVDFIANALDAAESQCDSLQFLCRYKTYVNYFDSNGNVTQTKKHQSEINCAYKLSKGYIIVSREEFLEGKDSALEPFKDILLCYGGKGTLKLDRTPDKDGLTNAEIFPGFKDNEFFSPTDNPRNFVYNVGSQRWCDLLKSSEYDFRVTESASINGIQVVKLEGRKAKGGGKYELWVSPDRSFLPVKYQFVRDLDNEIAGLHEFKDFVKLSNGLWFPQRIVQGGAEQYGIFIEKIDISPLSDDVFNPQFPSTSNTRVRDHVLDTVYITSGHNSINELLNTTAELAPQDIDTTEKALSKYVNDAQVKSETDDKQMQSPITEKPTAKDEDVIKSGPMKFLPIWLILSLLGLILLGGVVYVLFKKK